MDNISFNDCISCHNTVIKNKKTLYPILIDNSQYILCKACAMTNDYTEWNEFEEICSI